MGTNWANFGEFPETKRALVPGCLRNWNESGVVGSVDFGVAGGSGLSFPAAGLPGPKAAAGLPQSKALAPLSRAVERWSGGGLFTVHRMAVHQTGRKLVWRLPCRGSLVALGIRRARRQRLLDFCGVLAAVENSVDSHLVGFDSVVLAFLLGQVRPKGLHEADLLQSRKLPHLVFDGGHGFRYGIELWQRTRGRLKCRPGASVRKRGQPRCRSRGRVRLRRVEGGWRWAAGPWRSHHGLR
jgi:hypothetical protein